MTIDILPNQQTVQLTHVNGTTLGYGFAVPGAGDMNPEGDQVQRWILLDQDMKKWPPSTQSRMEPPTDADWNHKELAKFMESVRKKFEGGPPFYYVKVNCKRYDNLDTIPEDLREPAFLEPEPGGTQADIGTCQIRSGGDVVGYVHTFESDTMRRKEYWALFGSYRMPATGEEGAKVQNVLGTIESPNDFTGLFNKKIWDRSCTLVIAACTYYKAVPEHF